MLNPQRQAKVDAANPNLKTPTLRLNPSYIKAALLSHLGAFESGCIVVLLMFSNKT